MPTTYSNIVPVRRVAVGDCSGPLGSGFDALARSAYSAILRADWTQSPDPPFLPVHDNGQTANKTIPRGDAWKCSYGYDAAARTERSACGAVCYTFALPSDAYSGTPANISTVSLSLTGDRYLDAGVDLYIVPSASATPPSVSDLLALTPAGTYCATSDQSPTPPNERHGVTEAVTAALGVAAQSYLHVALLLHDYTTNRGAWIEGGAMLEGAAATIAFSRNVTADSPASLRVLRVSAAVPPASGQGEVVAAHALAQATILYHYEEALGSPPSSAEAFSDISQTMRLVRAGIVTAENDVRLSMAYTQGWLDNDTVLNADESEVTLTITAPMFHSPAVGGAWSVDTSWWSYGAACSCRFALVQLASAPPLIEGSELVSPSDIDPMLRAYFGQSADILCVTTASVPAGSEQSPQGFSAAFRAVPPPTMPYIALVPIVGTIGARVIYAEGAVLIPPANN